MSSYMQFWIFFDVINVPKMPIKFWGEERKHAKINRDTGPLSYLIKHEFLRVKTFVLL